MTYTKAKIDYTQKTREILDFALDGTSLEEKEELPTVDALKRSIRNNKNKSNPGFFKEPISVARILTADVQRRANSILRFGSCGSGALFRFHDGCIRTGLATMHYHRCRRYL